MLAFTAPCEYIAAVIIMESMERNGIHSNLSNFARKIPIYLAYFNVLYFFEIFFLTILLFISMGKLIAVLAGSVLSLTLAYHIVQIYYRSELHRKIQLILMDIHFAIAIAYFVRLFFSSHPMSMIFLSFIFIRIIITALEPVLLYLLTDRTVKTIFE